MKKSTKEKQKEAVVKKILLKKKQEYDGKKAFEESIDYLLERAR